MSINNKTSVLVDNLLPDYLDTEGPKFKQFIKAYYEWLETTNQMTNRAKGLEQYQDIDRTLDEFIDYFRREILESLPKDILSNKAITYKNIKDLYYAKGTESAFRILFRIIFDEEIDFYYPGDDILRASDGRWVQENTLRISAPFLGNPENFGGKNIVGQTSGATAKVNRVVSTTETGIPVYELFLIDIKGTFLDTEKVATTDNLLSGVIISSIGPLQGVILTYGGANHRKGDIVTLSSASGSSANGVITKTIDTSLDFSIIDGGRGYIVGNEISLSNESGSGAAATVSAISNTETIPSYSDTISSFADVVLNTGPTFVSLGANTAAVSANLASANISSVISASLGTSNTTVGSISQLTVTRGSNYTSIPTVKVINPAASVLKLSDGAGGIIGENAVIVANTVAGSITSIEINNSGSQYNRSDVITITNTSRANTENALGAGQITGIISYEGSYKDTRGFVSWNNRLQDSYFYQDFSYVVQSTKAYELYKQLSKKLTHPAGMKEFADVRISANLDLTTSILTEIVIKPSDIITPDILIPTVVSANTSVYEESGSDGAIDPEPEIEMPSDISIVDASNYDILIGNNYETEIEIKLATQTVAIDVNIVKELSDVTVNELFTVSEISVSNAINNLYYRDGSTILSPSSNVAFNDIVYTSLYSIGLPSVAYSINMPSVPVSNALVLFADTVISEFASEAISQEANTVIGSGYDPSRFGTSVLVSTLDPTSIDSTVTVPGNNELEMIIGNYGLISIGSTTIVPANNELYFVGQGTVGNFLIDEIADLSSASISDFASLYTSAGDGNKVFNGFSTSFTTQLVDNDVIKILDVNNSNEEITLTVAAIQDANTLSVTTNATFANGDLAIISNGTFLIVN